MGARDEAPGGRACGSGTLLVGRPVLGRGTSHHPPVLQLLLGERVVLRWDDVGDPLIHVTPLLC